MMRFIVVLLYIIVFSNISYGAVVVDNPSSYDIKGIVVSVDIVENSDHRSIALQNAKKMAYDVLIQHLNFSTDLSDMEIDQCIAVFSQKSISSTKDQEVYSIDISFDKASFRTVVSDHILISNTFKSKSKAIFATAVLDGKPDIWFAIMKAVRAANVAYNVISVTRDVVEIAFIDINIQSLERVLSDSNLKLIKNNNRYFIKRVGI